MQPANRRRPTSAPTTGRIRARHPRPASAPGIRARHPRPSLSTRFTVDNSRPAAIADARRTSPCRTGAAGCRPDCGRPVTACALPCPPADSHQCSRAGVTAPVSAPDPNRPYPESPVCRIAPNRLCMPRPAGRPDRIPAAGRDSRIIALSPCGIARRRLRGSRKRTLNRSSRRTACPASIAPQAVEPVGRHRGWRGSGGRAPGNAPGRTPGRRRPRLVGRGRRHEGERP